MFGLRPALGKEAAAAVQETSAPPPDPPPGRGPIDRIYDSILAELEPAFAMSLAQPELTERVRGLVTEIINNERLPLDRQEQETVTAEVLNDLIGFGPLESLLQDDTVS